jgi:hypothetical protein
MATRSTALRDLIEQRRAEILALLDQHKARSIAVVGSVARGDATVDSDVDFLVDFEPWSSLLDLIHLEGALSRLLGVDVAVISRGACSTVTRRSAATPWCCESIRRVSAGRHIDGRRRDRGDRRAGTGGLRHITPDSGHLPWFDRPEDVSTRTLEHLQTPPATST